MEKKFDEENRDVDTDLKKLIKTIMGLNNRIDLSYRAKIQFITRTIQRAKTKIVSAEKKFEAQNLKSTEDLDKTKKLLEILIQNRNEMKNEYEYAKLQQTSLQMSEETIFDKFYSKKEEIEKNDFRDKLDNRINLLEDEQK